MEPLAPVEPLITPRHLVLAAGTGIVTALLPVHRWEPRTQRRLHLAIAAVGGIATTAMLLAKPEEGESSAEEDAAPRVEATLNPRAKVMIGAGAAVLIGAASVAGAALDGWAERGLTRRGVTRPRVWMGLAGGVLSLGMDAVDRGLQRKASAQS